MTTKTSIEKIREALEAYQTLAETVDHSNAWSDQAEEALRLFDQEVGREPITTLFGSFNGYPDGTKLYASPLARGNNNQWFPIHTAPRDGSHIVVCKIGLTHDTRGYSPGSNEWNKIVFEERPSIESVWWVSSARFEKGKWRWIEPLCNPTHWMPLPAKPLARGSEPNTKEQGE